MRLITFQYQDDVFTGVLRDENIYPLPWSDLKHTAAAGMVAVEQAAAAAQPLPLVDVRLMAPIRHPGKIIAIGLNYMDHCLEQNLTPPERPTIFAKFPTAINHPGGEIRWHPALTQAVDYEAELAVVIGKKAYGVVYENAYDYVLGYTCLNDVTARDLQRDDKQWVRGKSLDTFCPMGPMIVTTDEIPDPQQLAIRCWVNGELRQDSHTSQLIYNVPALIAICSAAFTLEPGDVITTGTPGGVGVFRKPPIFLQPGDRIEVEIEHIGRLQNTVGPYLGKQA